jgi:CubicO group peptidase (beta-lactamase class C family)
MPWLHAVLVRRGGETLVERYWGGVERDLEFRLSDELAYSDPYTAGDGPTSLHNIKSVSKSVLSLLVGIAQENDGFDLDRPVAEHLPAAFARAPAGKRAITPRHLLTMRSGLDWVENGPVTQAWITSADRVAFTVEQRELVAHPGARFCYSTADTHLLAAALASVVGDLLAYADRVLFDPLECGPRRWTTTPEGLRIGGSEIFLALPDLEKLPRLLLNRGLAPSGTRVVSEEWLAASVLPQPGLGVAEIAAAAAPPPYEIPPGARRWLEGYGHLWWHTTFDGHAAVLGLGYGGQLAVAIPDLDLTIAQLAGTVIADDEWHYGRSTRVFELVDEVLLPSLDLP